VGSTVLDSDGKDGAKTVKEGEKDVTVTFGSLVDSNYDSGYTFAADKVSLNIIKLQISILDCFIISFNFIIFMC
jgi:hypothetical protein